MTDKRTYTPEEARQISLRARIADDTKHSREQDFLRAVYAQALGEVEYVEGARVKNTALGKMIEARRERDIAMTAYQEMINNE